MENVKIHEQLHKGGHNKMHFDINVKSESKNEKRTRETSTKVTITI